MRPVEERLPFTLACLRLAMNILFVYIMADMVAGLIQAGGGADGTKKETALVMVAVACSLIGMRLNDRLVRLLFPGSPTKGKPCEK
jgi:hypothetical protein